MNASTTSQPRPLNAEPEAHVVARHFRTGVRILLSLSLIATIVCLFVFKEAAYLAAIPLPVLYGILVFTNYLEARSRADNLRSSASPTIGRQEIDVDAETVGVVTLLKVLGVLAISAFIIAASFFEWQLVGAVAAGLFFLMLLIQLPYLPLYFSESEREEREKLSKPPR